MNLFRPNGLPKVRAMGGILVLCALSACASSKSTPGAVSRGAMQPSPADAIANILQNLPEEQLGPKPDGFINKPVRELELVTGKPALIRKEGKNEFRRYDLGACRAYAIVSPAGGKVAKISVGAAMTGAPKPTFEQCTSSVMRTGT